MNLKLPYEETHRAPRSLGLLLSVLALAVFVTGCGLSSDDDPDQQARTETTRTETTRTETTQTATVPQNTQSTDVPSDVPIQGSSPGVPSAPQGATPETQRQAQQQQLTEEQAAQQEEEGSQVTSGTTGTTGSAPPAAAGNLPEGSDSGAAAPVVGASGGDTPSSRFGAFEGVRPFSSSSPWNTLAQGLPTDARSAEMMRLANIRIAIVDRGGGRLERFEQANDEGLFINRRAWAPPIFTEQNGVTTTLRCRQLLRVCGDPIESLSIPADADPDPRYDGWFTVYDSPNGVAYDFWRARRDTDGSISYHFVRRWDLNDSGYLPPQRVSARGSGLPLFAGVITPQDIQQGRIEHALAISVPGAAQRRYVQPASRTDGNGRLNSLPEGARIRLRDGITVADLLNPNRRERDRRNADRTRSIEDLFDDQPEFDELDTTSGDPNDPLTAPRDPVTGRRLDANNFQDDEIDYVQLYEQLRPDRIQTEETTRRRVVQMIVDALKRYGAIVVDRAAVPTLYAQRNVDWRGILDGSEVQNIFLSDFEVIQLGPIYNDPPLTAAPAVQIPGEGPAPSTPGVTAGAQTTTTPSATTTTTPSTTSTTETTTTTESGE